MFRPLTRPSGYAHLRAVTVILADGTLSALLRGMETLIQTMFLLLRLADTVSLDEAAGTDGWCHEIAAITTQLAYAGDVDAFCADQPAGVPDYSSFCN